MYNDAWMCIIVINALFAYTTHHLCQLHIFVHGMHFVALENYRATTRAFLR